MKICKKCNQEKPKSEFHKDKNMFDGLSSSCGKCRNIVFKEYREKNKEKIKIYRENCKKKKKGEEYDLKEHLKIPTNFTKMKKETGIIYIIKEKTFTGWYKIGKTRKKPSRRLNEIKGQMPFKVELELIYWFETDDFHNVERDLHQTYWNKKQYNEYFSLTEEEVTYIKENYKSL